jgi:hypothetical protein
MEPRKLHVPNRDKSPSFRHSWLPTHPDQLDREFKRNTKNGPRQAGMCSEVACGHHANLARSRLGSYDSAQRTRTVP